MTARRPARKASMMLRYCSSILAGPWFAKARTATITAGRSPVFRLVDWHEPYLVLNLADLDRPKLVANEDPEPVGANQPSTLAVMEKLGAAARLKLAVPLLILNQEGHPDPLLVFDRADLQAIRRRRSCVRGMVENFREDARVNREDLPEGERGLAGWMAL